MEGPSIYLAAEQLQPFAGRRMMRVSGNSRIGISRLQGLVVLDQDIFAGVGNIIKNEVLFRTRTSPFMPVRRISAHTLRKTAAEARVFSFRFLELRRTFSLRKNLEVYGRSICVRCGGPIGRKAANGRV